VASNLHLPAEPQPLHADGSIQAQTGPGLVGSMYLGTPSTLKELLLNPSVVRYVPPFFLFAVLVKWACVVRRSRPYTAAGADEAVP